MAEKSKGLLAAAGVAIGVAGVVLIPLGAFLLYRQVLEKPGLREDPIVEAVEPAQDPSPPPRAHVFATDDDPEPRIRRQAVLKTPPPPSTPASAPKPVSKPAPLSLAAVPIGTEKAKVLAALGKPQMVTFGLDQGQPVETYHYLQRETGIEVIIRLRAGKVISAGTAVY